jgi:hypothetical protein
MKGTNKMINIVRQILTTLELNHRICGTKICVERDSMVNKFPNLSEEEAYKETLKRINNRFGEIMNCRLYWGMKNDDYLCLEILCLDIERTQ